MSEITPKLTVLMSVYNGDKFLERAIESILNQTYQDFEFIIINDGSIDNSIQILKKYEQTDKRICVYEQENKGLIASLNRGCRLARGEYIARMDADDISLPRRFEKQINYLDSHTEIGILGTWANVIDIQGNPKDVLCFPISDILIKWSLIFKNCIVHPSVMMRRIIVENLNCYRPQALHVEDYDLWTRALKITQIANLPEILLSYTNHGDSICTQHSETQQKNAVNLVIHPRIKQLLGTEPDVETVFNLREMTMGSFPEKLFQIETLVKLIIQLKRVYLKQNYSCSADKAEISHDVGNKIYNLANKALNFSISRGLLIYIKAITQNPMLILSPQIFATATKTLLGKFRK